MLTAAAAAIYITTTHMVCEGCQMSRSAEASGENTKGGVVVNDGKGTGRRGKDFF